MPLTVRRRNEIAWRFFLHHLRNRGKMYSVLETCEYFSKEYKIPNDESLHMTVKNGYYEVMFPDCPNFEGMDISVRNELAWLLHILHEFKKGVKIGKNFNRDIGNKAAEINDSKFAVNEYYVELIAVITGLLCENRWWLLEENDTFLLESVKAIVAKTSKVKSAEAGS